MALIQMSHTWADGSNLTVTLSGKARYPDALDQMCGEATRLWGQAMTEVCGPAIDDIEIVAVVEPTD